ncbi:MAG: DNA-processing protein DprA [Micrococcales bacterium]|nr:DNA-processing protein DprA [Micrococcales bacterium]
MIGRVRLAEGAVDRALGATPGERDRRARIAWARLAEAVDKDVQALVAEHGPQAALLRLPDLPALLTRVERRLADLDIDRDLEIAHRLGAHILVPGDDAWPTGVDGLAAPPHCLWARGSEPLSRLATRSVAVVGSRAATAYGESVAADISTGLVDARFTIVSGAAYGIDGAAHRAALAADGRTVAVLACGIDRPYPRAHDRLLAAIAGSGAVVSESPPGWAPLRSRFLSRNRLIAALSDGVLVVEAGMRSGTHNTVGWANALHRPVAAVPGPVTSMSSAGCHQLIRDNEATLVTDAAEAAELFGDLGADLAQPTLFEGPDAQLSPADRAVLSALPVRAPVGAERIAVTVAASVPATMSALGRLQLVGLAERTSSGLWKRASDR